MNIRKLKQIVEIFATNDKPNYHVYSMCHEYNPLNFKVIILPEAVFLKALYKYYSGYCTFCKRNYGTEGLLEDAAGFKDAILISPKPYPGRKRKLKISS